MEVLLSFSTHRTEVLPFAKGYLEQADWIILEEPYNPDFKRFLSEELDEETYLKTEDFWFPRFVKETLRMLRGFYKEGKKILQIEPYLERVKLIQERLERDESIDLDSDEELRKIYFLENNAVGKLLEFYEASLKGNFETIIEKVKSFSQADAERFKFRDYLRAKKIVEVLKTLPNEGRVYIEAGTIHQYFKKLLTLALKDKIKVLHKFLLEELFKALFHKPFVFPPGELLTLRYIFNLKKRDALENLLSARSLIYIKIIPKDELVPTEKDPFPHLRRELKAIMMTERLSFEDCKILYKRLFFIKDPEEGEREVENYIRKVLGSAVNLPDDSFFISIRNSFKRS